MACFEEISSPGGTLHFSVQGNDLMNALSISPQSAVEISVVEEGEPVEIKIIDEGLVTKVL